jgi:hypothetical protein
MASTVTTTVTSTISSPLVDAVLRDECVAVADVLPSLLYRNLADASHAANTEMLSHWIGVDDLKNRAPRTATEQACALLFQVMCGANKVDGADTETAANGDDDAAAAAADDDDDDDDIDVDGVTASGASDIAARRVVGCEWWVHRRPSDEWMSGEIGCKSMSAHTDICTHTRTHMSSSFLKHHFSAL